MSTGSFEPVIAGPVGPRACVHLSSSTRAGRIASAMECVTTSPIESGPRSTLRESEERYALGRGNSPSRLGQRCRGNRKLTATAAGRNTPGRPPKKPKARMDKALHPDDVAWDVQSGRATSGRWRQ